MTVVATLTPDWYSVILCRYGDRTPRSIPGRLFGIVWILLGVAMFAVFTASLSTSLSQDAAALTMPHGRKVHFNIILNIALNRKKRQGHNLVYTKVVYLFEMIV